ncbi:MAG: glycosyltransferase [Salinivirgaceae bacterium]|nr:glycosyltransferase [Salinivirgaceae bacterium]
MKLCIISHKIVFQNKQGYWAPGGFCSYVMGFSPFFEEIILLVPVRQSVDECAGDWLVGDNIRLIALPDYYDKWWEVNAFLYLKPIAETIKSALAKVDIVNLRASCFLTIIAYYITRKLNKPYFLSVFGDWKTLFRYAAKRGGWRRFFRYYGDVYESLILNRMIRKGPVFAHSKEMVQRFLVHNKWVFPCYSSTFTSHYIINHHKRINTDPLRILIVARTLSVNKGVVYLVKAIRKLVDQKYPVFLDVVGNDDADRTMKKTVKKEGVQKYVRFWGGLPHGPKFTERFDKASVLIVPSLSEGAPKVITEAMARGVFVVASNTGGIPDIIKDDNYGMLFPPGDVNAICETVKKIFENKSDIELKTKHGLKHAHDYTVEKNSKRMIDQLESSGLIVRNNNGILLNNNFSDSI